jgi:hypothetical protein
MRYILVFCALVSIGSVMGCQQAVNSSKPTTSQNAAGGGGY